MRIYPVSWLLVLSVAFMAACDRSSPSVGDSSGTATKSPRPPEIVSSGNAHPAKSAASLDGAAETPRPAQSAGDPHSPTWTPPAQGSPLSPDEAHRLLAGTIIFNPKSIPSSNTPVEQDTPLDLGQDLQVKWGGTWWTGTILGFESDGRVRVHYFGWANSYDEPKPRSELQLDRAARVHALESSYVRKGW